MSGKVRAALEDSGVDWRYWRLVNAGVCDLEGAYDLSLPDLVEAHAMLDATSEARDLAQEEAESKSKRKR